MRKSVWIPLAVLIALAAVAFVALPRLADVDRYRDTIRIRASERLGREVTLGDLELSWFPVFGVRVNDVAIAALPQEGEGAIVEAARIRIGARLGPLLRRRLEVTSIVIEEPELSLIRDEDGVWNLLATVEQDSQRDSENGADVSFERVSIRNGRLHLVDRKDREEPLRLSLEDIDLDLAAWTPGRPLVFEADFLADGADGADGGRAEIRGRLGPWTEDARPVDLAVAAPALPLDALRPLFDRDSRLSLREGSIGIDVKIHGDALARLALDGTLRMHEGRVAVRRPDGSTANVAFGMQVNFDVAVEDLGSRVDLRLAEIAIGAHRLAFEGTWSGAKDARTVDLRLLPARLPADDLAALLASAVGELPIAVSSNTPLELRGRIHGALGGGATPAIEATATLADVRIRHEAMGAPLENVRAVVALDGEVLRVNDFSGTVGGTDVAGSFELVGFEAPKIRFDLASARADFAELFSLLGSSGARTEAADDPDSVPPGRAAPALPELDIDGTLQVERGTFGTLGFDAMRSDMTWRNGVVRLSRLTTGLYGGSFDGLAEADLSSVVPAWRLAGEARDIDVRAFLAENTEAEDLLSGRFSGAVDVTTSGAVEDAILRALHGGGGVRIDAGRIGRLDVLGTLSKVSGLFGEATVRRLTRRLAAEGTEFRALTGTLAFEGGVIRLSSMRLEAPDFDCTGDSNVDLFSGELAGAYRLRLSPDVSLAMREEGSRAADLFWDAKTDRVDMPFGLNGPFVEPSASVDLGLAARGKAEQRFREEASAWLTERLGGRREESADPPEPPDPPENESEENPPETGTVAGPDGLRGSIVSTRWSGPLLARDLTVEGTVGGSELRGAALIVTDADGAELRRIDSIEIVRAALAADADAAKAAGDAGLPWSVTIDGKRLALARYPLTLELRVTGAGEAAVSIERPVPRF